MIEKRKRLCISLNARLVKELRLNCKKQKQTVSRAIEEIIFFNKKYRREIIPQIKELRALIKQLKSKEKRKKK